MYPLCGKSPSTIGWIYHQINSLLFTEKFDGFYECFEENLGKHRLYSEIIKFSSVTTCNELECKIINLDLLLDNYGN